MTRDWESWLQNAAQPASPTEESERDRTEARIRQAIRASDELPDTVHVYTKGSYANNTNVRRDADVDVAVEWTEHFYVDTWGETAGMGPNELGYEPAVDMISPQDFRGRVERALTEALGAGVIDATGEKAIDVPAGPGTLDTDVVPCFNLRRYDQPSPTGYVEGHRIVTRSGGFVDNFPQQHYKNGVAKNTMTSGRFKKVVRCTKRLEGELLDAGLISKDYPSYLMECLVYNVVNGQFGHSRLFDDVEAAFDFLWDGLQDEGTYSSWTEVNDLVMLFRGHSDRIPGNALALIDRAWRFMRDS